MRRILLALLIIYTPAAWAQIGPSNYPAATVPLNGVDAVLLDQGSGCATHVASCTTSQAASTRIGQPVQQTTAPTSPFQYQQWIDTSLSPPKLKEFIGSTWFVVANLDPTNGFSFTIPSTSVAGLGTMATQNANAVAITGGTITGMPTPTNGGDVASKSYVDSVATALVPQTAVKYATAAILPNTPTYSNGASGVGATLTAGSNTTLTVDGNVAGINDRVLVKNQADQTQNGCYAISQVGSGAAPWVLTRCIDWDQSAEMKQNSYFFTSSGSVNAATSWFLANGGITVGSSAIVFQQFSASNVYSASTGLTLGGSAFSITATGVTATSYGTATQVPTITVNAQGQITTASNTSISIPATQITSGLLSVARGGTAADLTATGGTSQVLRQSSAGAAITVGQIGASDLSNGTFSGTVSALNYQIAGHPFGSASGTYNLLADGSGNNAILLGGAGDPETYYRNTAHVFGNIGGGTIYALFNGAGIYLAGGPLRLGASYTAGVLVTDASGNVTNVATTGTGAVMLAASPTSTGTLSAAGITAGALNVNNTVAGGFGGQFSMTNTSGGATNPTKTFRIGSTGTLEFVDSTYTNVLLSLTDAGTLTAAGAIFANNDTNFGLSKNVISGDKFYNFAPSTYLSFTASTGDFTLVFSGRSNFVWRQSDGLAYNPIAATGGNGAYVNISDRRVKQADTIAPITKGLDAILALNPVHFKRNRAIAAAETMSPQSELVVSAAGKAPVVVDMTPADMPTELGFIAQDVQAVIPEAVRAVGVKLPDGSGGPDSANPTLGIATEMMIPVLVNAVKELDSRIKALEPKR